MLFCWYKLIFFVFTSIFFGNFLKFRWKRFFGKQKFWWNKILVKKNLGQNIGQKYLGRKFLVSKKIWVKKIWVRNFIRLKKLGLEILQGETKFGSKIVWVKKILGKFFFGLTNFCWKFFGSKKMLVRIFFYLKDFGQNFFLTLQNFDPQSTGC